MAIGIVALALLTLPADAARRRAIERPEPIPTFNREIVRIFQQNCQVCHRPEGIAPFSLMDYESAKPWHGLIRYMTETRQMPPWPAASNCGEFAGEMRLTEKEITRIRRWSEADAPEGHPGDLPPRLDFDSGWTHGEPEVILEAAETYVPAPFGDSWRCFVLDIDSERDLHAQAVEYLPSHPEAVHHMIAYLDTSGRARELDAEDPGAGYDYLTYGLGFDPAGLVAFYVPGTLPIALPPGLAIPIPAGSSIVLQTHYHPHQGRPVEPDRPRIGIHPARETVRSLLRFMTISQPDLVLPPDEAAISITAGFPISEPMRIRALQPHMHSLGRSVIVEHVDAAGHRNCLIRIDDWDPRWQNVYQIEEPILLNPGDSLHVEAVYDNSSANPRNPHSPPREVRWGESAEDEMLIIGVLYTLENEQVEIPPN